MAEVVEIFGVMADFFVDLWNGKSDIKKILKSIKTYDYRLSCLNHLSVL